MSPSSEFVMEREAEALFRKLIAAIRTCRLTEAKTEGHALSVKAYQKVKREVIDAMRQKRPAAPARIEREREEAIELVTKLTNTTRKLWRDRARGGYDSCLQEEYQHLTVKVIDALCGVRPREPSRLDECRADLRANGTMLAWIEEEVKHAKIERLVAGRRVSVLEDLQEKALIRAGKIERAIGLEEEEAGLE